MISTSLGQIRRLFLRAVASKALPSLSFAASRFISRALGFEPATSAPVAATPEA
jgi:hypothetical protein